MARGRKKVSTESLDEKIELQKATLEKAKAKYEADKESKNRDYLKEYNPMMFEHLVLEGRLWTYLADLNEKAQSRIQLVIRQMQEAESVTEELKAYEQMAWVQAMKTEFPLPAKKWSKI